MTAPAPRSVIDLGHGFYNLRGSFRLFGIDLKTQASLVRLASGGFVLLDAIELDEEQARWLDAMTEGGDALEAVLHLHPFHTVSVRSMHERYPDAKLHGTPRHRREKDALPWDDLHTDDPALHARYADDLAFTVPRGVELVPADPNVHFSSVLAVHPASKTLHVDDTLIYAKLPKLVRWAKKDILRFHPTLAKALERRAGAAGDFRAWARELVDLAGDLDQLCAAHTSVLRVERDGGPPIAARIERALERVDKTLARHERAHG